MREGYAEGEGEVRPPRESRGSPAFLAVDTGGTFTDFLLVREGKISALKVHSTPDDPARAILEGIRELLRAPEGLEFHLVHGSTVATNALLERKGARVVLLTNAGFEDMLEIGRQNRPQLYALVGHRPPPLVLSTDRIGIGGRLDFAGDEVVPLDPAELAGLPERLEGAEAVAVVLLHSYANSRHEDEVSQALAKLVVPLSLSSRILPEFREFERTSTTVANAYVSPKMAGYLKRLELSSGAGAIRIMGSSGGALSLGRAISEPVHTVLSGPAGGVVGALEWGRRCGVEALLSFDMGGTSTDVSLLPGRLLHTSEGKVGDVPLAIPLLDIHTVGAGGGSIARIDAGGALRVGPESAGAVPGPISYGKGGAEVTVTDANLWLGRLHPSGLLGGEAGLDRGALEVPMRGLAESAGVSPDEVAEAILEVANTAMEGALRVISIERGIDPGGFHLLAFGGAAGLHAVDLAERLGAKGVLIPPEPGLLSAFGMLVAPVVRDRARTVFLASERAGADDMIGEVFDELEVAGRGEMLEDGILDERIVASRWIDARYVDQSFELRIPAEGWVEGFHIAHEERFGYRRPGVEVEAVTLRVRLESAGDAVMLPLANRSSYGAAPGLQVDPTSYGAAPGLQVGPTSYGAAPPAPLQASRPVQASRSSVLWCGQWIDATVLQRADFRMGSRIDGPALLLEYSSTTWCPPGWAVRADPSGVLILERI